MDKATFPETFDYSDTYVAREFEGLQRNESFFENEYHAMRSLQKVDLVNMFTKDTRRLYFSRLMRKPLTAFQNRVDQMLGKI